MPVLTVVMSQQDLTHLDTLAKKTHRTRSDLVRAILSRVQIVQPDLAVVPISLDTDDLTRPEMPK